MPLKEEPDPPEETMAGAPPEPTLLWPEHIIQKFKYPNKPLDIPNYRDDHPNYFSRDIISEILGGFPRVKDCPVDQSKERPYKCRWYKCLQAIWNPHLPERPGAPGADLDFKRTEPGENADAIPVFCKRGKREWEYVSNYFVVYNNDHIRESELLHPSIRNMLSFWVRNDFKNASTDTIIGWFRVPSILKAYWVYLEFRKYDPKLYRLLDEARNRQEVKNSLEEDEKKKEVDVKKAEKKNEAEQARALKNPNNKLQKSKLLPPKEEDDDEGMTPSRSA